MTTNHADKLDDALLRKGRVDYREKFPDHHKAYYDIFKRISPDRAMPDLTGLTPAEIQAVAIECRQ